VKVWEIDGKEIEVKEQNEALDFIQAVSDGKSGLHTLSSHGPTLSAASIPSAAFAEPMGSIDGIFSQAVYAMYQ
jgi:hypothetical protein